jgi:uncharacterized membrane protein HdeD (DUF308 family)
MTTHVQPRLRQTLHDNWGVFLVQGILLVIGGAAAILLPQVATVAFSIFLGWLLLIVGAVHFVSLLTSRQMPGFWGSLLLSALMVILGGLLIFRPLQGVISLTIALVAYFIIHGFATLYLAFSLRMDTSRWVWLLLGVVLDFLLAGLVIAGWPNTAGWILGLYVGINMLFAGFALIFAALGARPETETPGTATGRQAL